MASRALFIGGSGPTGRHIVSGLSERGFSVTTLNRGLHSAPDLEADIERLIADPFSERSLGEALQGRVFDLCVAAYGSLRLTAKLTQGRAARFISIGGSPAYAGYMNPWVCRPTGLPVPTGENAPLVASEVDDPKGLRVVAAERAVFSHHPQATHFRYPFIYGPYQPLPREWCVVRRVLDGRKRLILPDGGLSLISCAYAENAARAVLLACDQPEASRGQIFNCGDYETLSLRAWAEVLAEALGASLEIVSMPFAAAVPARPLLMQPESTHRVLDTSKLRYVLGYYDLVPAREALARTAGWLADNRPEPKGIEEQILQDPFDYAAEDMLIDAWETRFASLPEVSFRDFSPSFTMAYSGPVRVPD